jgi:hypothetical protein
MDPRHVLSSSPISLDTAEPKLRHLWIEVTVPIVQPRSALQFHHVVPLLLCVCVCASGSEGRRMERMGERRHREGFHSRTSPASRPRSNLAKASENSKRDHASGDGYQPMGVPPLVDYSWPQ